MGNKKRDPLKNVIRKIELDKPSPDFTHSVMKEITAREGVSVNPVLKSLLKRHGVEQTPVAFTHDVMALVEARKFKPADQPIISRKVWAIVTAAIASFVLYFGFVDQKQQSPDGVTPYLIGVGNTLNSIFIHINAIPSIYLLTCIALGGLIVVDYLLRNLSHRQSDKGQVS